MRKASIIIRTRNEERWINSCLEAVFRQEYSDFEVVLVDNASSDRTLSLARGFPVRVVEYAGKFFPGRVLNEGIRQTTGELLVMLSGHCIPTNSRWLTNLLAHFGDPGLAGVYGRQEPLGYTSDRDKRDLWTVFQLDRKVQRRDCFFHNANSAIRRDLWEAFPFSETVTNIEDRIWAKEALRRGLHLIYEPEASVFHWHGIHQDDNGERRRNVVRIIEHLELAESSTGTVIDIPGSGPEVLAVIPVRGQSPRVGDRSLLSFTVERALKSARIGRVVVSTDHPETCRLAAELGAEAPFLRPPELSHDYIGIDEVVGHAVNVLANQGYRPDWVLVLKETHPFRPRGFLDELIHEAIANDHEMIIPVHRNHVAIYRRENASVVVVHDGSTPAGVSEPHYLGNAGLGKMINYQLAVQRGASPQRTGIYVVDDQLAELMIRTQAEAEEMKGVLQEFWRRESALEEDSALAQGCLLRPKP